MRSNRRVWFPVAALDLPDRLLLAAVALLPWAFGGIEIWAFRLAGLLIVVAATLRIGASRRVEWELSRIRWLLVPAVLMLGLAFVQLLPLPPGLLQQVSPKAYELYASTFPGYEAGEPTDAIAWLEARALSEVPEAEGVASPREATEPVSVSVGGRWDGWRPISLAPDFTLERIFWFIPLLIAFLMFHAGARDPERRRVFEAVLFVDFLALAFFGLIFAAIGNDRLYWIRPTVQETSPFGPYVNPAHFAAVMELAVPWVAAAAWSARRLKRKSALPFPILLATAASCLLAGILSGSRAAVVLMLAAVLALVFLAPGERIARGLLAAATVGIALVASAAILLLGAGGRIATFFELGAGGLADVERLAGWRAAGTMLSDFLTTGVGVGAFREVFPIYAPAGGDARMAHLHNDYFEILVETGWPGALLLLWMIACFAWLALANARRSFRARGVAIGLVCLFLHAAVDFNHQIPANALLFVAAAGILLAREDFD